MRFRQVLEQARPRRPDGFKGERLEAKYFMSRTDRTPLARDLAVVMGSDSHADESGSYLVRSIYFDTPDYMLYQEKIAGLANRFKPRVRVYGEDPSRAAFVRFEIKSRLSTHGSKTAATVSREAYEELEEAIRRRSLPPSHLLEDDVLREFFRLQKLYNLEPKVLVQYRREAFEREELGRIRVNLDDELVATRTLDLFGPLEGEQAIMERGAAIFEIKAEDFLPYWLHTLIGKFDLSNEAISKYCLAVRSQGRLSAAGRADDEY